jgi:hypothetical protein
VFGYGPWWPNQTNISPTLGQSHHQTLSEEIPEEIEEYDLISPGNYL